MSALELEASAGDRRLAVGEAGLLLELRGLSKRYGDRDALAPLHLGVRPGEIWAVVGANGAGKTTLLRLLAGLQHRSAGAILWEGRAIDPAADRHFRAMVGYAPEQPGLRGRWTIRESLAFFAGLRNLPAEEAPPSLRLGDLLDRPVDTLSRGQAQRVGLAVALLGRPRLLLLDEPHGGLDPGLLDSLAQLLRELREAGTSVLLTTHVFSAIAAACTHLLLLHEGRRLASGRLADLLADNREPTETSLHQLFRSLTVPACA